MSFSVSSKRPFHAAGNSAGSLTPSSGTAENHSFSHITKRLNLPNVTSQYNCRTILSALRAALQSLCKYNTIQYNTIQYNTIQYNTIQYNTIQYNTIQYNTIQYNAMQCNAMQCNAMQCNAMQCNAMQCNAMQCNAMQCNTIQYNNNNNSCLFYSDHSCLGISGRFTQ